MTVQLTPYIMLDGNAAEAISFYEQALDAVVVFRESFGEGPENPERPMTDDVKKRVAHAVLKVGEAELLVADCVPGEPNDSGNRLTICITSSEIGQSRRYYEALQQGGEVNLPLQELYFSPAYGVVTDKFGVTFLIFTKRG
ncbi:VOC family protein [Paenibacillus arenilitoris]|uniref:VOC family protein n=1 Tax=Paenibacillus arenilitoris TaxID=2772299 RepID=A0A927CKJ3_9BACL|nr:VOC family protein [Paenibacillus arenilitoris]MBD2869244.1 VOC family protein [Paenibacillus arenilitoris]